MSWGVKKSDIDTVYKLSTDAWEKLGKIWLRMKVSYCNKKMHEGSIKGNLSRIKEIVMIP